MDRNVTREICAFDGGEVPQLQDIRLMSDGWIKKYVLTYLMPGGETYEYEAVSRKGIDEYRAALERNASGGDGANSASGTEAADNGDNDGNDGKSAGCGKGSGSRSSVGGDTSPQMADAVCIVPILPDGSLLLIREFRYAVNGWVIAFPAGLIERGEALRVSVDRELLEETGYRVRHTIDEGGDFEGEPVVSLSQSGYSSVGMGDENVHVVIAQVERGGDACPEPSELIETFELARENIGVFLDGNRDLIGTRCQLLLEGMREDSRAW